MYFFSLSSVLKVKPSFLYTETMMITKYYFNILIKYRLLNSSCFLISSATGEGKLLSKDGSVYEGSFHNHKQHGEGKLIYW